VVRRVVLTLLTLAIAASLPDARAGATDLHNVLTDYVITSWNNKEGLPPGVVWALAQDADGYLWVGNDAGLFRFDGERFVAWNAPLGDRCAIGGGSLVDVYPRREPVDRFRWQRWRRSSRERTLAPVRCSGRSRSRRRRRLG